MAAALAAKDIEGELQVHGESSWSDGLSGDQPVELGTGRQAVEIAFTGGGQRADRGGPVQRGLGVEAVQVGAERTLTDAELDAIVLDPAEHSDRQVLTVDEWRSVMDPVSFGSLLDADAARRTGTARYTQHQPVQCRRPDGSRI